MRIVQVSDVLTAEVPGNNQSQILFVYAARKKVVSYAHTVADIVHRNPRAPSRPDRDGWGGGAKAVSSPFFPCIANRHNVKQK